MYTIPYTRIGRPKFVITLVTTLRGLVLTKTRTTLTVLVNDRINAWYPLVEMATDVTNKDRSLFVEE